MPAGFERAADLLAAVLGGGAALGFAEVDCVSQSRIKHISLSLLHPSAAVVVTTSNLLQHNWPWALRRSSSCLAWDVAQRRKPAMVVAGTR